MDKRLKLLVIFSLFFFVFCFLSFKLLQRSRKGKGVLQTAFTIILWWPYQPQRRPSLCSRDNYMVYVAHAPGHGHYYYYYY